MMNSARRSFQLLCAMVFRLEESSPEGSEPGAEEKAAAELLLTLFKELLQGLEPDLTFAIISDWAEGKWGSQLLALGRQEIEAAQIAGLEELCFCLNTK